MNNENNILPDNPSIQVLKAGQSGIFTNYIYKAIPLAFDESMSYYETLCGLLNYLQNTIIPTVNNNADAVSELQNLFIELHDYIEHYFDNLDVQQEINNKLDEMAQDGSLTLLIKNYVDPFIDEQNQTINEINSNVNTLTTRMNSFTELTEGSTTGDAELIDARIGYQGQKYPNLGTAIRSVDKGLFDETSNYVSRARTINLFNKYDAIVGYYINSSGELGTGASLTASNYIPCEANDVLIPSTNLTRAYYNSNKELIEYRSNTSTDFSCPSNTAYARFSVATSLIDRYVIFKSTGEDDVTPKYDIPYYTYSINGGLIPEILDARKSANQDYLTLGDSIRNQIKSLFDDSSNYVTRTRTINLFNKYDAIIGYYLSSTGDYTAGESFAISNYIPCEANDVLIPSTTLARCYYDSDKKLIEYRPYNNSNFTCPSNTAYARFTVAYASINTYVIFKSTGAGDTTPKTGIPYYNYSLKVEANNFENETYKIFRKVCCVGDSLTEGYILNSDHETPMVDNNYSWPHYMATSSGNTYYNCGSSGANTKTWLERQNGLAKAQAYGNVQAYIIGLGFNDGLPYDGYHLDLGTPADIGTDTQSFYGCMSKIVRELHTISEDAYIFMQTIPSTNVSRYGTYNEAIKYICNLYAETYKTHLLDLENYIDLYDTTLLNTDSQYGHFTAIGYQICSKNLQYIWSKYLNDHSEQFRDLPDVPID